MVTIGPANKTSPATAFYLDATVISQNIAGNYSTVRLTVRAYNSGNTSSNFGNYGQHYGAIDGIGTVVNHAAQPFLPSGFGTGALRWADSGDYNYYHDANGYAGSLTIRMGMIYGSVNESHTAVLDLPRIPKVPDAPTPLSLDMIGPVSMRYRFSGNGNGGSGITGWQIRYATNASFTGATIVAGTGTDVLTALTPGMPYYVQSRGVNGIGAGPWSTTLTATTLSGGRAWDGTAHRNCRVRYWNGSAFQNVRVRSWDGTSWRNTR